MEEKALEVVPVQVPVVRSINDVPLAVACVREIKALKEEITATFAKQKKEADELHKTIIAAERKYTAPLDIAEKQCRDGIADAVKMYTAEQQDIYNKGAGKARLAAIKKLQKEVERLQAVGKDSTAKGHELALMVAMVPELPKPKIDGLSWYPKKKPVITDAIALAQAVLDGKVPATVLQFDFKAIGQLADAGVELPGVVIYTENTYRIAGEK